MDGELWKRDHVWEIVAGSCALVSVPWFLLVPVYWFPCVGSRVLVPVCWFPCAGSRVLVPVHWFPCIGSRVLVSVYWFLCVGFGVLVPECWFPCIGSRVLVSVCWFPCDGSRGGSRVSSARASPTASMCVCVHYGTIIMPACSATPQRAL